MSLKGEMSRFYRKFSNRPPIATADATVQALHAEDVVQWMALIDRLTLDTSSDKEVVESLKITGKCVNSLFDIGDDITAWLAQRNISSVAEMRFPGTTAAYHLAQAAQLCISLYLHEEAEMFLERMRRHFTEMDHVIASQYWRFRGLLANVRRNWETAIPNYILSVEHLDRTLDSEFREWFDADRESFIMAGNLAIADCWIHLGWESNGADRVRCCNKARKYLLKTRNLKQSPLQLQLRALNEIELMILEEQYAQAEERIGFLFDHVPSSRRAVILHPALHCMKARMAFVKEQYKEMIGHLSRAVAESTLFPNALQELMIVDYAIHLIREVSLRRELLFPLLEAMVMMLEAKDWYTGRDHSRSVAELSVAIWNKVSREHPENQRDIIYWAGYLHDIGKLRLPRSLLNKLAPLHDPEWELLRRHPTYGKELLEEFQVPEIAQLVSEHHQDRLGTGYPGDTPASMMGMCIALADIMEASTSPSRKYQRPKTIREALAMLEQDKHRYPKELVRAVRSVFAEMT